MSLNGRLERLEREARAAMQPQERAYVSIDPYDWAALEDEITPDWKREELMQKYELHGFRGKIYIGLSPDDWPEPVGKNAT